MSELRAYGLVKNCSAVDQQIGSYKIAPGSIGRMPATVVENMRRVPIAGLVVIDDHPDLITFFRTDVAAFGPRYQG